MNNNVEVNFKVCVRCMTYNQANYITDALNGFTMQKTDYPFVCCVIDDASTDGEKNVIREYLQSHFDLDDTSVVRNEETDDFFLTFAQHRTNRNCYFAVLYLKYNHYSRPECRGRKLKYISEWHDYVKYIAFCEGDDYWTDTHKLQMQTDYLDGHPNVVLSCHRYTIQDVTTGNVIVFKNKYFDSKKGKYAASFEFDLRYNYSVEWVTKTLTLMLRREVYNQNIQYILKQFQYARDVHTVYFAMKQGLGVCHALCAGVYRKNVSTSIYGKFTRAEQTSIDRKVYAELAATTNDPIIQSRTNHFIVKECMNMLKPIGGGYFCALRYVRLLNKYIIWPIKKHF